MNPLDLEIRLLGPLQIGLDGSSILVTGRRRAELLARLAVTTGQVVSAERLLADVWGDGAAATATKQLHIVVSKLRETLENPELIVTQWPGYLLDLPAERVDVHLFTMLVRRARACSRDSDAAQAAALLRQALNLWRGAPFEGLSAPWAQVEAARLEEARATAIEELADVRLALGEYEELVPELVSHTAQHPFRERPRAQLMVALSRLGRPAAALDVYGDARQALVEQLGLEPSADLRRLHRMALNGELASDESPRAPRPAQLPADTSAFTARQLELARLHELLQVPGVGQSPVPTTVAVNGPGGIGKSALAVHAAHGVADHFQDGVLYVNLHGSTPGIDPLPPAGALARLLRSLGETGPIPGSVEESAALYRSLTANRHVLVVLDNASDVHQVRPLLPAGGGCGVLVTSRRPLSTLDDAHHLHLAGLADDEAARLLSRLAGPDRTGAEPDAVRDLVRLCGGLPLAVRIMGARLVARPDWRVADLAARLADTRRRLDALEHDDLAVRATIAVSHQQLRAEPSGADGAEMLSLTGLIDVPDLPVASAAALSGWPEDRAEAALDRLVDNRLMNAGAPGRYHAHDLPRLYAREQAAGLPQEVRASAVDRVMNHYLATLARASVLVDASTAALVNDYPATRPGLDLTDAAAATSWVRGERDNLLALVRQAAEVAEPRTAIGLALTLCRPFGALAWFRELVEVSERAVAVAARSGDALAEARALDRLGVACREQRRVEEAVTHHLAALDRLRRAGLPETAVEAYSGLTTAYRQLGRYEEAIDAADRGLSGARATGSRNSEAVYLATQGQIWFHLERHDLAVERLRESLKVWAELDSPYGALIAQANLSDVYFDGLEDYGEAVAAYRHGVDLARAAGHRYGELAMLWGVGRSLRALGEEDGAVEHIRLSITIMRELDLITADEADEMTANAHDPDLPVPEAFRRKGDK